MLTKKEEYEILTKIVDIIENTGKDSYLYNSFIGFEELATNNITNDFINNYVNIINNRENEINMLKNEIDGLKKTIDEKNAIIQSFKDKRKEIENYMNDLRLKLHQALDIIEDKIEY